MRSGHGGPGAVSFRREKYVPKGGPDGGDGGRGGDVVFVAKPNVKTLSSVKMQRRFYAQNGRPGAGRRKHGARGADAIVEVPPGTAVIDPENGDRLADLVCAGERCVLLEGGRGGKGNTHFKSSRQQIPRFAQPGESGQERTVRVELQVIADVGFVGMPNAGKSTLLKAMTAADPKIGSYPFTTVIPNLGVLHHHERDVVLADIPGLIEGAAGGAGLGVRFLKHVERSSALAFTIDVSDPAPVRSFETLLKELQAYDRSLLKKRILIVLTKHDLIEAGAAVPGVQEQFVASISQKKRALSIDDPEIVTVSAVTSYGLDALKTAVVKVAAENPTEPTRREGGGTDA